MIIPLAALIGVLLPGLLGGRLRRLASVRLRGGALIGGAFLVQFAALQVLDGPRLLLQAVHVATYVAAAGFLWLNRLLPGLPVLGLGAALNGVTIALNGGTLPASPSALAAAGLTDEAGFVNSGVLDEPRLAFLGDVFAIPASWPLANVFSVGDVLIVLGATYASLRLCGTRWRRPCWLPPAHRSPHARPAVAPGSPMPPPGLA